MQAPPPSSLLGVGVVRPLTAAPLGQLLAPLPAAKVQVTEADRVAWMRQFLNALEQWKVCLDDLHAAEKQPAAAGTGDVFGAAPSLAGTAPGPMAGLPPPQVPGFPGVQAPGAGLLPPPAAAFPGLLGTQMGGTHDALRRPPMAAVGLLEAPPPAKRSRHEDEAAGENT
eukprot:TRINITY_DN81844_c0_g1_i1.p1 TRINITY_DN81844_c0_g1~~TRINITY_DN81844_c0_g1_i1.p1  ORF type:complete len:169 (-),score=48.55 TRINITY_DN81844_c0_g1_i1:28-534(-)